MLVELHFTRWEGTREDDDCSLESAWVFTPEGSEVSAVAKHSWSNNKAIPSGKFYRMKE